MAALVAALESYKVESGYYPKASIPFGPNQPGSANILFQALAVSNASYNPAGKIFFEASKSDCATTNFSSTANYFVDSFGQPYQYRYPGDECGAAHRSGSQSLPGPQWGGD